MNGGGGILSGAPAPAYVCTNTGARAPFGAPDPDSPCCWASAQDPDECTCWRPVHVDQDITGLIERSNDVAEGPPAIRSLMCGDCAYRPGSPERADNDGDAPIFTSRQRFYCHQGMPLIGGWWHPSGVVRPSPEPKGDYDPVIKGDRTWQADGTPAVLCAGWAAHNRLPKPKVAHR